MSARKEFFMRSRRTSALVVLLALVIGPLLVAATAQGTPEGEMVLAWHVTIAPAWFDPIDTPRRSPLWRPACPPRCLGTASSG
jgi:hypothetical protein